MNSLTPWPPNCLNRRLSSGGTAGSAGEGCAGVTRIPEYFSWVAAENRVYIDEPEGTSFVNLKMISQMLLPWSTAPAAGFTSRSSLAMSASYWSDVTPGQCMNIATAIPMPPSLCRSRVSDTAYAGAG